MLVGSDKDGFAPSPCIGLLSQDFVGQTLESKASVGVFKENLLQCRQPQITDHPNTFSILSARNPFNFHSPNLGSVQVAMKNCDSMGLSADSIKKLGSSS